ncbi:MAG: ABC transporter ATP-binding protein [Thaumarchaeota archaeon]|nr:ABC transporter ATP-binding protein [Nitrososphaerota archaeon]
MNAIELTNVSKIYKIRSDKRDSIYEHMSKINKRRSSKEIVALDDISLSVKMGEMVGIIGHNGSGKTTLLKIITQITSPTKGKILINGRVIPFLQLGSGFQGEFNAIDNIRMHGVILGLKKKEIESKIEEVLRYSELERFAYIPVKHYSTGMFVRLAFATAIQVEPDILVLDEVLAVGDLSFQKKSYQTFLSLRGNGKTIVYVSHNLSEVEKLCDKVALLNDGRLEAFGESKEVISKYKDIIESSINDKDIWIVEKITEFYKTMLGREPDKAGLVDFVLKIKSGKLAIEDVPEIIKNSQEYSEKTPF